MVPSLRSVRLRTVAVATQDVNVGVHLAGEETRAVLVLGRMVEVDLQTLLLYLDLQTMVSCLNQDQEANVLLKIVTNQDSDVGVNLVVGEILAVLVMLWDRQILYIIYKK